MTVFWRHITALQAGPLPLPTQTREILAKIARTNRRCALFARLKVLSLPGLTRQTWAETLLFRLWFLLG
jgi:hypothetical protein